MMLLNTKTKKSCYNNNYSCSGHGKHQQKSASITAFNWIGWTACIYIARRAAWHMTIINPRRACAARVTVVGSVCLCVCLLSHISPLERLFVLKTLSRTQRATKVNTFVGFSLKPLRCRDPALPPSTAIRTVGHFSCGKRHACAL